MSLATLTKVISMARAVDAIEMTAFEQVSEQQRFVSVSMSFDPDGKN